MTEIKDTTEKEGQLLLLPRPSSIGRSVSAASLPLASAICQLRTADTSLLTEGRFYLIYQHWRRLGGGRRRSFHRYVLACDARNIIPTLTNTQTKRQYTRKSSIFFPKILSTARLSSSLPHVQRFKSNYYQYAPPPPVPTDCLELFTPQMTFTSSNFIFSG